MTRHRADRAERIVDFILRYTLEHGGFGPSVRDIGPAVGLSSTSATHHHLAALAKRGVLAHHPHRGYVVAPIQVTAEAIELAWCEKTHGMKPPRVRPCKRHRTMAEWLSLIVLPRAQAIAATRKAA